MTRSTSIIIAAAVGFLLTMPAAAASQTTATAMPSTPDGQASQPPRDPSEPPLIQPQPFWTTRRIVIIAGYAAAIGMGMLTLSKERELRAQRRSVEALPPGATDQFNRGVAEAKDLLGARDLLGALTVSVAAGTTVYALSPRFAGSNSLVPGLRTAGKSAWRVSLAWAF